MSLDLSLYLVTDTEQCGSRGVAATVAAAVAGGVTAVQVRDHHASTRELVQLCRAVAQVLEGSGVPLLVDDRLDVALAVGAQGVHLGQSDLAVADARKIAGDALIIGLSVSSAEQLLAVPPGADYLGIGPYRATPTKPDAAAPLGLAGVESLVAATALPTVVIGGVKVADVAPIRRAGADGVAVVSAICAAADPRAAAAEQLHAAGRNV